jgi:hypothetical protein
MVTPAAPVVMATRPAEDEDDGYMVTQQYPLTVHPGPSAAMTEEVMQCTLCAAWWPSGASLGFSGLRLPPGPHCSVHTGLYMAEELLHCKPHPTTCRFLK